jgi:phosphoglycerol transferase MdoB-like AlkP superfamily enzyme
MVKYIKQIMYSFVFFGIAFLLVIFKKDITDKIAFGISILGILNFIYWRYKEYSENN